MSSPQIPRSSPSQQPSYASSSTLTSRQHDRGSNQYDAIHTSERNGHGNRIALGPEGIGSPDTRVSENSPGSVDMSEEQESGIKVQKTRKAGGFLLPSAFQPRHKSGDAKGKRKADIEPASSAQKTTPYNAGRLNESSMRSSPLAQVVVTPRPVAGDGTSSRASSERNTLASGGRSSHDAASGHGSRESSGEHGPQTVQQPGAFDPAQIVNMALNLSESRRRNLTAGHLLPPQAAAGRRAVSSAGQTGPAPSSMLQGSYQAYGAGGSLRHHLQQQRRISRAHSPGTASRTHTSRNVSAASYAPPLDTTGVTPYHFSDSTFARAEKARQYIELSVEHRRLLQFLPPLKPDSTAPGNSQFTTSSVPGSANVQLSRSQTNRGTEKHVLGRMYNPVQMIRNRKLRTRMRSLLDPDVGEWEDSARVRDWVDEVEDASQEPNYRGEDKVALPPFPPGGSVVLGKDEKAGADNSNVKQKRPRMDWVTSPAEQLADAYWLEQGNHKSMIENKHSTRIYPGMGSTESIRARASFESRHSRTASLAPSAGSYERPRHDMDNSIQDDRGRKNGILPHGRDDSRSGLKAVWHKAHRRSKSAASTLSSSDDGISITGERRKADKLAPDEENVGPLELHMNNMLNAERGQSPTLISPGTPNKWGIDQSAGLMSRAAAHPETEPEVIKSGLQKTEVTDWIDEQNGQSHKNKSNKKGLTLNHQANPRSSFEEDLDTNPNTPISTHFVPSIGVQLSPPTSRTTSPSRWPSKVSKLPFSRADKVKDTWKHGTSPVQIDDDDRNSRHTSAEAGTQPRSSFEATVSPSRVKNVLNKEKGNESSNSLSPRPSSRGKDSRDHKEPDSAVRRFFKGGRLGEIVRHEGSRVGSSFKKRDSPQEVTKNLSGSDTESMEETDVEDDSIRRVKSRPRQAQRDLSVTSEPQPFGRPDRNRYYIDGLPSFRPAHGSKQSSQVYTPGGVDHITHQQRALKHNRSARFDSMAPPGLDLSKVDTMTTDSADTSRQNTFNTANTSREDRRNSYGFPPIEKQNSRLGPRVAAILEKPGGVGRGGLPATGLSHVEEQNRSRPSLADRRHWSISDKPNSRSPHPIASSSISSADVARVRALFICSGIKAASISRRAHRPHDTVPSFLRKAADISGAEFLRPVPRKEAHVLAARLLTNSLENETTALHNDATVFRSDTIASLRSKLEDMKDLVSACVEQARNGSDESVRFGAEITGQKTIEVQRVVDGLERLARVRRRRMRWIRRIGFGLVEWAVVAFMWWIWLCVVLLRSVWRIFTGTVRVVKWVFWL
ncbi:hypothetical protein EJ08DRAFT_5718 [Tothia fuscella]|uniref:Uncharacterized protein n=1 Tax=Tothia fuscella TaxID=1048955 RepID=A0A9P4P4T2_9PEZI|nr:hypothetical protein EJ08DRAFT_5718 [Tothia fuscella]